MSNVFICCCDSDASVAETIHAYLKARSSRIKPWLYTKDGVASVDHTQQSRFQINTSIACIVVLSPASPKSLYLGIELHNARSRGLPILPVLVDTTYDNFKLTSVDWAIWIGTLTAVEWRDEQDCEKILRGCNHIIDSLRRRRAIIVTVGATVLLVIASLIWAAGPRRHVPSESASNANERPSPEHGTGQDKPTVTPVTKIRPKDNRGREKNSTDIFRIGQRVTCIGRDNDLVFQYRFKDRGTGENHAVPVGTTGVVSNVDKASSQIQVDWNVPGFPEWWMTSDAVAPLDPESANPHPNL